MGLKGNGWAGGAGGRCRVAGIVAGFIAGEAGVPTPACGHPSPVRGRGDVRRGGWRVVVGAVAGIVADFFADSERRVVSHGRQPRSGLDFAWFDGVQWPGQWPGQWPHVWQMGMAGCSMMGQLAVGWLAVKTAPEGAARRKTCLRRLGARGEVGAEWWPEMLPKLLPEMLPEMLPMLPAIPFLVLGQSVVVGNFRDF